MIFLMFVVLLLLILSGFPIAFSLISVAFVFGWAELGPGAIYQFQLKLNDIASNYIIAAIPLFVFMGCILQSAGVADRMFLVINRLMRRVPGGLGVSAILLCIVFAASSGVSGATEAIVGMLAIPVMQSTRYPNDLISGIICAGGSLGTIIPPSIFVLILAPAAQLPVIDLFKATLVPGLLLAAGYAIYVILRVAISHRDTIAVSAGEAADTFSWRDVVESISAFAPPVGLIVLVLGSILMGWATPTEAAALGAIGSLCIGLLHRRLSLFVLKDATTKTVFVSCMIVTILFGGSIFSAIFVVGGGLSAATGFFDSLNAAPYLILFAILLTTFLMGFVLDQISMILILIPLSIPLVTAAGFDPIWFSVLFLMTIQTSYLTPPMAPAIFFLRGINPPGITLSQMYRGVLPFICVQITVIALLIAVPSLVWVW